MATASENMRNITFVDPPWAVSAEVGRWPIHSRSSKVLTTWSEFSATAGHARAQTTLTEFSETESVPGTGGGATEAKSRGYPLALLVPGKTEVLSGWGLSEYAILDGAMRFEILHQPAYALAKIFLDPGEGVRAETGSMVAMSSTVDLNAGLVGGIGKALGRMLTGETAFQSVYTAARGSGEVWLAPSTLGDIAAIELRGDAFFLSSGAFLAADPELTVRSRTSLRGFLSGEGMFMMRVDGVGTILASALGGILSRELQHGESFKVDTGHVVAFSESMNVKVRKAARSFFGSVVSREGVVAEFTGPGIVYIQGRSPDAFAAYITSFLEPPS